MTDAETTARALLDQLRDAIAAKDLEALSALFDDDVVLFSTASAALDRDETIAYLTIVTAQDDVIRWSWDTVSPLVDEPGLLVFAVVGTVGLESVDGQPASEGSSFRLTVVAVERDGRWLLRHFHGSVPEGE